MSERPAASADEGAGEAPETRSHVRRSVPREDEAPTVSDQPALSRDAPPPDETPTTVQQPAFRPDAEPANVSYATTAPLPADPTPLPANAAFAATAPLPADPTPLPAQFAATAPLPADPTPPPKAAFASTAPLLPGDVLPDGTPRVAAKTDALSAAPRRAATSSSVPAWVYAVAFVAVVVVFSLIGFAAVWWIGT